MPLQITPLVCRFEDVLQIQDCNIILRHCGDARRWDDLSKVVSDDYHNS